jgi:hypothetical protein
MLSMRRPAEVDCWAPLRRRTSRPQLRTSSCSSQSREFTVLAAAARAAPSPWRDESRFVGEGHRKVWAQLRRQGIGTSRKRVLRLIREAGLLAPTPQVRKRAERLHEGTITVTVPDTLWATDATEAWTR